MFLVQPTEKPLSLLTIYVPDPDTPPLSPEGIPPSRSPYFSPRKRRSRRPARETPSLFSNEELTTSESCGVRTSHALASSQRTKRKAAESKETLSSSSLCVLCDSVVSPSVPSESMAKTRTKSRRPGLCEQLHSPEVDLLIRAAVAAERARCAEVALTVGSEDPALLFIGSEMAWKRCARRIHEVLTRRWKGIRWPRQSFLC